MPYSIKYQIDFLNNDEKSFSIFLLLKDYAGTVTQLTAGPNPFVLSYTSGDDKIINPIRASEAEINFYNDGATPLTEFYSEDDEAWRIDFYYNDPLGAKLIWSGFIVQDACQETFQEPPHLVALKGTDNLALLKDIPFNKAFTDTTVIISKLSLFEYIKYSLIKTGISLPLAIYSNIYENTMPDRDDDTGNDMFRQTHLFAGMFQSEDGTWDDCYSILEKILFPLRATLCQAQGRWNIIRFGEFKLIANSTLPGSLYDTNFDIYTAVNLAPNVSFAIGSNNILINADHITRILRPFNSVKFTFDYVQPRELVRNLDLNELGPLIQTYTDVNGNTISQYQIAWWYYSGGAPPPNAYIQIVVSPPPKAEELGRYLVIYGGNPATIACLQSSSFYIDKNDRVNVSFNLSTANHNNGPGNNIFHFEVTDGTTTYRMNWNNGNMQDGSWATNGAAILSLSSKDDLKNGLSFSVESLGSPISGNFSILVNQCDSQTPTLETFYQNFSLEYIPHIDQNLMPVNGQSHLQEYSDTIKNKLDEKILIDDSPKHAFAGALLTATVTNGVYVTLTSLWHRFNFNEAKRLGEITTFETQDIQSKPRTILEGSFKYDDPTVSVLNMVQVDTLPNLNFIFGVVQFDFMQAIFSATLWEICATGEPAADTDYSFKYIYETK